MVGLPFRYRNRDVYYATGTSMGALFSWVWFALGHHFLVFLLCRQLRKDFKTAQYMILGDDILFGDPELGEAYMAQLEFMGVPFSPHKTLISDHTFEMAKRVGHRGAEVTPFPVSAVLDVWRSVPLLVASLLGEEKKGLKPVGGIPAAVRDLDRRRRQALGQEARYGDSRKRQAAVCEAVTRFVSSERTDEDLLRVSEVVLSRVRPEVRDPLLSSIPELRALWFRAFASLFSASLEDRATQGPLRKLVEQSLRWSAENVDLGFSPELLAGRASPILSAISPIGLAAHRLVATVPTGEPVDHML